MEHPLYSTFKMHSVLILVVLSTICRKCMYKSHLVIKVYELRERSSSNFRRKFHIQNLFVLRFWVLCERSINIFFFVEHYACSVFNVCIMSCILIVDFTLSLVTQSPRVKRFYFQSSRCFAK